jgi:hypothetical protein
MAFQDILNNRVDTPKQISVHLGEAHDVIGG